MGFPMMYSSSQTVCGTSGRAVAAWLLLEPLLCSCRAVLDRFRLLNGQISAFVNVFDKFSSFPVVNHQFDEVFDRFPNFRHVFRTSERLNLGLC